MPDMIPWWRVDLGDAEVAAVTKAIGDRNIQYGPVGRELERRLAERLRVPHVVLTSSGSAALFLSLRACGVAAGDEVILPAASFIASAHACLLAGATVRLVDIRTDRPLLDPDLIENALTSRTKAIMPVHLNGASCDMVAIRALARKHGLKVIEDACQALGSDNASGPLGAQGDAGAFSMSIAKLLTTGEGGFVAVRDPDTYERLLRLRNQGTQAVANNIFDHFGFNFRLTDVAAAMGLAQLARLPSRIEALRRVYTFYKRELADVGGVTMCGARMENGELPLWAQILCDDRDGVIALLERHGIQSRPVNPCLAASPHLGASGPYPHAERFARQGLRLPCGPDQPQENLRRTVEVLRTLVSRTIGKTCSHE